MELITLLKINALGFLIFFFVMFIIAAGALWSRFNNDNDLKP